MGIVGRIIKHAWGLLVRESSVENGGGNFFLLLRGYHITCGLRFLIGACAGCNAGGFLVSTNMRPFSTEMGGRQLKDNPMQNYKYVYKSNTLHQTNSWQ